MNLNTDPFPGIMRRCTMHTPFNEREGKNEGKNEGKRELMAPTSAGSSLVAFALTLSV